MLKSSGIYIQWDWLTNSDNAEIGLTEETIKKALLQSEFSDIKIKFPFVMQSSKSSMPVIMAICKNTKQKI